MVPSLGHSGICLCQRSSVSNWTPKIHLGELTSLIDFIGIYYALISSTGSPLDPTANNQVFHRKGYEWPMGMILQRNQHQIEQTTKKMYDVLYSTYCRKHQPGDGLLLSASDKRDYIYGLISLIEEDYETLGMIVSYDKSWQELYSEIAQCLITSGHLDILALCQKNGSDIRGLPSWAPVWHEEIEKPNPYFHDSLAGENQLFSASSSTEVLPTFSIITNTNGESVRMMRQGGVIFDIILDAKSTFLGTRALQSPERISLCRQLFTDIQSLCKQSEELGFGVYTPLSLGEAVWRIPVRDIELGYDSEDDGRKNNYRRATEKTRKSHKRYLRLFQAVEEHLAAEKSSQQSPESKFFDSILAWHRQQFHKLRSATFMFMFNTSRYAGYRWLWSCVKSVPMLFHTLLDNMEDLEGNRGIQYTQWLHGMEGPPVTPFITHRGYIGLGPKSLEPGDIVCIFFGARVPHILRRRGGGQRGFIFVGQAFAYGIMDGEYLTDHREGIEFEIF